MADDMTIKMRNQMYLDRLFSDDAGISKKAQDESTDYVRQKAREEGIFRAVLPSQGTTLEECDRQVGVTEPCKIYDVEPTLPSPIILPFASEPPAIEFEGGEGVVVFHEISTVKHRATKYELGQYRMDIRKVITDLDLYELLEKEDATFIAAVDNLVGPADTTLSVAGVALHRTISSGLTDRGWAECMKIMMRAGSRFRPKTVVINQVAAEDLLSWSADELGDAFKQEISERGWTRKEFKGKNLVVTNKTNLVGENEVYMFAAADELGRHYQLDDVTLYSEVKNTNLEWFSKECMGASIQALGCAKATLNP